MRSGPEKTGALVLAAGKGTRMKSELPKVLVPALDQPILYYVLRTLDRCGDIFASTAAVVGHKGELVQRYISSAWESVVPIWQHQQLGTGHAVQIAREWWTGLDNLLVLPGDVPLLTSDSLRALVERHVADSADCSFITFSARNPFGYGRVVRDGSSNVASIVEERDATPEQRSLREVNSGIYIFRVSSLLPHIDRLSNENAQGEYYLPDIIDLMIRCGMRVATVMTEWEDEFRGINTQLQLAEAVSLLREDIVRSHLAQGVRMLDPSTVWIGPEVHLGEGAVLDPYVQLWGATTVGRGCEIGSFSILRDMQLADDVRVLSHSVLSGSSLARGARVGPFIVIRDGAVLEEEAQAGKFVEIKKSVVGRRSKVPHLTYMGDASVGEGSNVGAGTVTCNYDGERKHPTRIGDRCFVGSGTMLVAPVTVGNDSFIAAGSVVTSDVPEDALAVGRARQKNIEGWASKRKRLRKGD
ncbi:MAG TPA: UDP-N-acetylglucosamine diphosphorylase/glucosamine-1-phosphate N-acetyltransferase [Synergistaceae bacterium]|jgi:bifunctional UDP-N-acetylglucosamine pyrophosphorylase/glucosamine-1-phosphate N-acetyltransferase|nr:UDP-N-acetylglucosamine diphosphorylase/glucosamine-1-phosphate N-acetyltransferase [Synergistaceae bacterium]